MAAKSPFGLTLKEIIDLGLAGDISPLDIDAMREAGPHYLYGGGVSQDPARTGVPRQSGSYGASYNPAGFAEAGFGQQSGPGTSGAAFSPGMFTDPKFTGELFPIDDPQKATRNYLTWQGQSPNPYSGAWTRVLNNFSLGLLPQFLTQQMRNYQGSTNMPQEFRDFIGSRWSGGTAPMNFQQAQVGLGELNALLRQQMEMAANPQAVRLDPRLQAIAGMFTDPEAQARLMVSMYLPSLGPAMANALRRVVEHQQQQWADYEDLAQNQTPGRPRSLLDFLTGSLGL